MTFSCLSAATSPAISSRIAHESLLQLLYFKFSRVQCVPQIIPPPLRVLRIRRGRGCILRVIPWACFKFGEICDQNGTPASSRGTWGVHIYFIYTTRRQSENPFFYYVTLLSRGSED